MGIDNLIVSMKLLKESGHKVHLTIGGQGPEKRALENLVNDLRIGADIRFVGYIASTEMAKYYTGADFFIMPTKRLEGFGLVTTESLACGTPVLGTPVGGTREILSGLDPDFLFENNTTEAIAKGVREAIESYYHDERAYRALRDKCSHFAQENYSWDRHVSTLAEVIDEAILEGPQESRRI